MFAELVYKSGRPTAYMFGCEGWRCSGRPTAYVFGCEGWRCSGRPTAYVGPKKSALESIKRVADGENSPFVKRTRKRKQLPISRNLEIIASKPYFIILIGRGGNGPRQKKTIVIGYKKEDILC